MITFEISGRFNTTAQQKGVTIKYGKPYFYEKPEVKALRNQLYFYCKPHRPPEPFGGAVRLKVIFYYKTTKKKQIGQFKTTRPDLDNLNKLLWDVLTDTGFFKDDSQIVIFEARKGYGEEDKIKISISEIEVSTDYKIDPLYL